MSTMSARRMITVKQHDRYPTTWTVSMDLTGTTTRLLARRSNAAVIELPHTVIDAPGGVVQHILDGTLPVADYRVELEITRADEIITAPTDGYENLRVITDLG